jgi:GTPase SAR1 family protein
MAGSTDLRAVHVLVCGDDAVGKTTIIDTLFSGCFSKDVEEVKGRLNANGSWGEVVIPGQINTQTDVQVNLVVVDTSSRTASKRMEVLTKMKEADVVVLVYAIDNEDTFNRLEDHWLQPIQRVCQQHFDNKARFSPTVPIVLVGNKIDKRAGDKTIDRSGALQNKVMPILEKYPEVEACLECSAAALLNIRQVFYFAQKAVIYPLKPLYNMRDACLQNDFRIALKRIFRIFDCDRDGFLSDEELNLFQVQCFAAQMEAADIAAVKKALQAEVGEAVAIVNDRITLEGFIQLNTMFILRNRPESSWMLLRHFGYERDGDIALHMILDDIDEPEASLPTARSFWSAAVTDESMDNSHLPRLNRRQDQNTELSDRALAFLNSLFKQYKEEIHEGVEVLRESQIEGIFEVAPENPWRSDPRFNFPNGVPVLYIPTKVTAQSTPPGSRDGATESVGVDDLELAMPRSSWLGMWCMMGALDAHATMRYMWYLGYPGDSLERGSIAKQIHLKWPANKLHVVQALRLTSPRSTIKFAKNLDKKIVRSFLFGKTRVGRQVLLRSLVFGQGSGSAQDTGAAAGTSEANRGVNDSSTAPLRDSARMFVRNEGLGSGVMVDENDADFFVSVGQDSVRANSAIKLFPQGKDGGEVALMITDMGSIVPQDNMDACDVVCIAFETSDRQTLPYLTDLQARIPDHIPCVYVGIRDNENGEEDVTMDHAEELCASYKLDAPFVVSRDESDPALQSVFEDLIVSALQPGTNGKRPVSQEKQRQLAQRSMITKYSLITLAIATVVGVAYAGHRYNLFGSSSKEQSKTHPVRDVVVDK